jgi:hypothetical protein
MSPSRDLLVRVTSVQFKISAGNRQPVTFPWCLGCTLLEQVCRTALLQETHPHRCQHAALLHPPPCKRSIMTIILDRARVVCNKRSQICKLQDINSILQAKETRTSLECPVPSGKQEHCQGESGYVRQQGLYPFCSKNNRLHCHAAQKKKKWNLTFCKPPNKMMTHLRPVKGNKPSVYKIPCICGRL